MAETSERKKPPVIEPPDDLRCRRTGGHTWRCKHWRIHDQPYCEDHFLALRANKNNKKPKPPSTSSASASAQRDNAKRLRERDEEEATVPEKGKHKKKLKLESPKEQVELLLLDRKARSREKIKQTLMRLDECLEIDDEKPLKTTKTKSFSSSSKSNAAKPKISVSESGMCHQCQKSDRTVARCRKCRKRFCVPCIRRWYPQMTKEAIEKSCPYCQGNCNCKSCLRRKDVYVDSGDLGVPQNKDEKIRHLKHLVRALYPFLEQFNHEQQSEMEMEAKTKGLLLSDVEVKKIVCSKDERIYCNNCKTSITDFHRSCPSCSYDLCLTCCREIRCNFLSGEIVEQCVVVSNAHSHGGEPLDPHSCKKESSDIYLESSSVRPEHLWKAMKNGAIPCSPKDNGGCGYEYLELKCIFPQNWISKLREKVKRLIKVHGLEDKPTVSAWCSSCFKSHDEIGSINENLRKAATREGSSDNYLYCPSASDVKYGDLEHFQGHWIKGEPVIVRNALELTSGLSWEPMVMWRAMRELTYHGSKHLNVKAIDCLDWCEVNILTHTEEVTFSSQHLTKIEMLKQKYVADSAVKCKSTLEENISVQANDLSVLNWSSLIQMSKMENVGPCRKHATAKPPNDSILEKNGKAMASDRELNSSTSGVEVLVGVNAPVLHENISLNSSSALTANHAESLMKEDEMDLSKCDVNMVDVEAKEKWSSPKDIKVGDGKEDFISSLCIIRNDEVQDDIVNEIGAKSGISFEIENGEMINSEERNAIIEREIVVKSSHDLDLKSELNALSSKLQIGKKDWKEENVEEVKKSNTVSSVVHTSMNEAPQQDAGYISQPVDSGNMDSGQEFAKGGAVWDIFRRQDVHRLEEYLKKYCREFRHLHCSQVEKVFHPIHDQVFYLTSYHKRVEPWTFIQNLGEAVFIPAGCPHQVRNLKSCIKVALDFVSPENIQECIRLTEEFRSLPKNHKAKEDKLGVKKMCLYALRKAADDLEKLEG
ncbi:hypothetical protein AAZV13_11G188000 [Glycine max]